jgi:hypothetical protein
MNALYERCLYDRWVVTTLGKDDSSSAIALIKIDSLYDSAIDGDPIIVVDPACAEMLTNSCEVTQNHDLRVVVKILSFKRVLYSF